MPNATSRQFLCAGGRVEQRKVLRGYAEDVVMCILAFSTFQLFNSKLKRKSDSVLGVLLMVLINNVKEENYT